MKALILSGGLGTRLRPLTYSQQKQLIPVANKPILFYAIEDVIKAGAQEIGIIIGPNKEQVMDTVNSQTWPVPIKFIYQDYPKGLAHTILVAEDFLKDGPFIMYLGDNILEDDIEKHSKTFTDKGFDAYIMLCEVDNPQEFGIAEVNDKGEIVNLVEKPKEPKSNLAVIGVYYFTSPIIQGAKAIKPSWRNQLEIVDAISWMMENGYKVGYATVTGWWKDTGQPEDIIHANRLVLDDIEEKSEGEVKDSEIMGRVVIGKQSKIVNSKIKGPVIIGENSVIEDTFIGPYTSIGNNCKIIKSEIEDSVIMGECEIIGTGRISESLIGRGAKITESDKLPKAHSFVLGDNSEVII
jgi:glucose-1-phosphate thymidylyltransferase